MLFRNEDQLIGICNYVTGQYNNCERQTADVTWTAEQKDGGQYRLTAQWIAEVRDNGLSDPRLHDIKERFVDRSATVHPWMDWEALTREIEYILSQVQETEYITAR